MRFHREAGYCRRNYWRSVRDTVEPPIDVASVVSGYSHEGEMTGRFEWHITVPSSARSQAQRTAEGSNWVFSEITGCPILGHGTYCYITGFDTDFDAAKREMGAIACELRTRSVEVLREKIENIVYDTKTGVGVTS